MRKTAIAAATAISIATVSGFLLWQPANDSSTLGRKGPPVNREQKESPVESAFWDWRVSYPTGRFDPAWYDQALPQHERMAKSVPGKDRALDKSSRGVLDPLQATALGPAPLDWPAGYGRVGGRVNVIATHPTNASIAWFGSDGGGVWKTTNCCGPATTWQPKTDLPQIANIAIGSITLDPNNPDRLYVGTGDFRRNRPFTFGAGGLLTSGDGGETWSVLGASVFNPVYTQPIGMFPQYRAISTTVVDPNDSTKLVVGTNQGLYFSYDSGSNWSGPCVTNGFSTQRQDVTGLIAIDNGSSTDLVAAIGGIGTVSSVRFDLRFNGANGLYRTTLPGSGCPATWSLISRPDNGWPAGTGSGIQVGSPGGNPLRRIDIAIAPSNSNVMYAQASRLGVWRTLDGGATWTLRTTRPTDFNFGCVSGAFSNGMLFEEYNAGVLVSPTDPNVVFLSSTDTWRSTDGADTFTNLTCGYGELTVGQPGYVHVDQHARAFVAGDPQRLLIGTDGGVYSSDNALAATPLFAARNEGTSTIEFYSGDISARFNDPALSTRAIVGGAQDNGSSNFVWSGGATPGPAVWTLRFGGDGIFAKIEPILGQRWYYSSQFGYLAASITGPLVEPNQLVSPDNDWLSDRRGFIMPFDLYKFGGESTCPAATGCQRMLAGTFRVWESVSGGLPNTSWYVNSPDLTKALSTDSNLSILNKVEHARSEPTVAITGSNDGNVYYGFGLGAGSANSATWINVTGGNSVLPNRPVMDVVSDPFDATIAYAALTGFDQNTPSTPGHVFRLACTTECVSFTWEDKSGNLPNIPVNAIQINPNLPNQAFAGTDWGLYYTDDISAVRPVWNRFDAGLPAAMIWDLVVDRGATTLAIFTRSRGAYVWPLPLSDLIFANGFD